MRVCFVAERFLGHVSYIDRLREFIDAQENIDSEYIYMENLDYPLRLFSNTAIPLLKRYDLDLHSVRWQVTYSYSARRRLRKVITGNGFDAVYFHTQNVALLSHHIAERFPTVISCDATNQLLSSMGWDGRLPFTKMTWKPGILLERRLYQEATKIIAWSQWVKESLLKDYSVEEDRIDVIPPFVPIPSNATKRENNGRPRLLFVGRDFGRKGGDDLLRCFKKHFQKNCELHIVTQSNIPKDKNMFVYHDISESKLESLYRSADVFIFPTKKDCSPQVVLEAMSFRLPIVSTRVGALPEMVIHGRNGFLYSPENVNELPNLVEHLVDDGSLRQEMGVESRRMVERKFNLPTNARSICDVLLEVAG